MLANTSLPSNVVSSSPASIPFGQGVLLLAFEGEWLPLIVSNGCRFAVLRPWVLARDALLTALTRAWAGDMAFTDFLGFVRLGLGLVPLSMAA